MLDMGFIHDVKKIISKVPAKRQTIFFSATMPTEISKLANTILTDPTRVEVTPVSSTANTIQQAVYHVDKDKKKSLLNHLLNTENINTALVFTRTKHGADRVVKDLTRAGISAEAIHGNKSQNARQRALSNFKAQKTRVLVATDIAARGIDIDELSHVINYELPNIPETYVHRIGRTGRAGASGISISFCDGEEREFLKDIHKLIGKTIPVVSEHPYPASANTSYSGETKRPAQGNRFGGRNNNRSSNNGARSSSNTTRNSNNGNRSEKSARPTNGNSRASGNVRASSNNNTWSNGPSRERNYNY
jgi:Superfamily II DNA and RNA helicases